MDITFITPTYNRHTTLPKTAESILRQTNPNWRWIIVDDGSTDGTKEFIESLTDQRVTYIYQGNAGPSAARNKALEHVKTDWVAYVDSDNEIEHMFVERVAQYIRDNKGVLYLLPKAHRVKEYYENGQLINIIDESSTYPDMVSVKDLVHRHVKFDGNGFVHSMEVIADSVRWDESLWMIEDFDFFLTVASKFPDSFVYIPESLVTYHMRFGVDTLISNAKMTEHARAYDYVFHKHKGDAGMKGQGWYPLQFKKFFSKAREAGEKIYYGSIGILYRRVNDVNKYLVVENAKTGNFSFVSGACEQGDRSEEETLRRELREELGDNIENISPISTGIRQDFIFGPRKIERAGCLGSYQAFLVDVTHIGDNIFHTKELNSIRWLNKDEALKLLSFDDVKEVFTLATKDLL